MANARADQLVRETFAQDTHNARATQLVREAFVRVPDAAVDQLVREARVLDATNARADQLLREAFAFGTPAARAVQLIREAFVAIVNPGAIMPIIYPLTIPTLLGESKADLTKFDAIGEFISEFTGSAEQQQWQDQHWELQLEWPEMTASQYAAFDAFTGALHGKLGSFLWGPPLRTAPQGSGSGTPVLNTGNVSGTNTLYTVNWAAGASNLLMPGDYLQLGPYILPITGVMVEAPGNLFVYASTTYSSAVAEFLAGESATFYGLTNATWLNGATLTISYVNSEVSGLVMAMATVPPGMPSSYGYTADTGNATAAPARLYLYVDSTGLQSDVHGNATFDIFPCLREALPPGVPLTLVNPQGTFRLADNRRTGSSDEKKTTKLKLKCREAI